MTKKVLRLEAPSNEVAFWLSALADTRERTLDALRGFPADRIDGSGLGTLLYHVAIVEADWLFDEILGTMETDFPKDLFPVEMRADGEHLTPFTGESLAEHLARLAKIRGMLVATITPMSSEELHAIHERRHYDVSPAWVLHHLMQHEAEHRSQIVGLREAL